MWHRQPRMSVISGDRNTFQQGWCKNSIWKFLEISDPKKTFHENYSSSCFPFLSLFPSSYSLGFFFSPSFISLRDYNYGSLGVPECLHHPCLTDCVNHPQKPQANAWLLSGQCSWDSIETAQISLAAAWSSQAFFIPLSYCSSCRDSLDAGFGNCSFSVFSHHHNLHLNIL